LLIVKVSPERVAFAPLRKSAVGDLADQSATIQLQKELGSLQE
jgi:hypothetical protein